MAFKTLYTAHATVTGGRGEGHGATDDGRVTVDFSMPAGLGGDDGPGTNPEQLFALGYAACFEGAIAGVAKSLEADHEGLTIDSSVDIGKTADGLGIQAKLDVTLPKLDEETAGKVVAEAHKHCPYSKATRGNIDVTLVANGVTL